MPALKLFGFSFGKKKSDDDDWEDDDVVDDDEDLDDEDEDLDAGTPEDGESRGQRPGGR